MASLIRDATGTERSNDLTSERLDRRSMLLGRVLAPVLAYGAFDLVALRIFWLNIHCTLRDSKSEFLAGFRSSAAVAPALPGPPEEVHVADAISAPGRTRHCNRFSCRRAVAL